MAEAKIKLSVDGAQAASQGIDTVGQALHKMGLSADAIGGKLSALQGRVGGLIAGMASLAGVAVLTGFARDVIEADASLNDLAISAGVTSEALSALADVGKYSGQSADSIAAAMNKLSKNLAGVDEEGAGAAAALRFMGLDLATLKSQKPEEQFKTLANALGEFERGGGKSALAMALLGKSGAQLLPMMDDLAQGQDLVTKATTAQTEAADALSDNWLRLKSSGQEWGKEIVREMVPTLNLTVQAILAVTKQSSDLRSETDTLAANNSIQAWTKNSVFALSYLADGLAGVWRVAESVARSFYGIGEMGAASLSGLAKMMVNIRNLEFGEAAKSAKELTANIVNLNKTTSDGIETLLQKKLPGQAFREQFEQLSKVSEVAKKIKKDASQFSLSALKTDTLKDEISAHDTIAAAIAKERALTQAQLDLGRELLESEKFRITTQESMNKEALRGKLTEQERLSLEGQLGAAVELRAGLERKIAEQKAIEKNTAAYEKYLEAGQRDIEQLVAGNEQLRLQNQSIGLSEEALHALAISRAEAAIAQAQMNLVEAQNIEGNTERAAQIEREIFLLGTRRDLLTDGRTATVLAEQLKQEAGLWQQVEQGWRSAFDAMGRKGESVFDRLKNSLKDGLLALLYDMTAKRFLVNIAASVSGAGVAQQAFGAAGGIGSSAGGAGAAGASIFDVINGGFSAMTSGVSSAIGEMGMRMLASNNAMVSSLGSSVINASGAIGSAAGIAAGVASGLTIGKAISGQFGSNATVNVGTLAGTILGGPIGGAIGGAIGGLLNRAFGMGATEVKSQGLEGNFNGGGFAGNTYANKFQEGGWFRSDKNWRETGALDAATNEAFSTGFADIKNASTEAAKALGLSANSIANYSQAMSLQLTDDAAKNKELVSKFFVDMADAMAKSAAPSIEAFAKKGETASAAFNRLGVALTGVNATLDTVGHTLLQVSLNGGDAASKLADLLGGVDKLASLSASFRSSYYTEAENAAKSTTDMAKALGTLNIALPTTKDGFKALVLAQDLTTEAGRKAYATLIAIAPEFATTFDTLGKIAKDAADKQAQIAKDAADAVTAMLGGISQAFTSVLDGIRDEADNVANARLDILGSRQKSLGEIQLGISGINTALPSQATVKYYESSLAAQAGVLSAIEATSGYLGESGYYYDARETQNYQAALGTYNFFAANLKAAQDAYAVALQGFAANAAKSVTQLGKLREETVRYYEAQKQLAELMGSSATNLRASVSAARFGQLDSAQSLAQRQADFAKNYSMALSTTGANKAGYADKLGAALPDLNAALQDTANSRFEWAVASAALFAQSETIAKQLEDTAPKDYQAESLGLLTQIDTSLSLLGDSTQFVVDAIKNGSNLTAAGLRGVITALGGVPSFDVGTNYVPRDMFARVHEGEAIVPKRYNVPSTAQRSDYTEVVAELKALRADNQNMQTALNAIAITNHKTANILERVTPDGSSLQTVAA